MGKCSVSVTHNNTTSKATLYVIDSDKYPPLLGRPWLAAMTLDWAQVHHISPNAGETTPLPHADDIRKKYPVLFSDSLGKMKGAQAKIDLRENAKPRFLKARSVPVALREKVNNDIDRLVQDGVLEPVRFSDWATPVVPVVKGDGSVRICGDFKVTVNPVLLIDEYPQPRREDLFAGLAGGQIFSKLDLAQAYLQMEVEPESRKHLTINTPKGLFQYNRLVFRIASAPAIFQRTIESILQRIPGVLVYQGDILVTGKTNAEHETSLHTVLKRLEEHNLRVRLDKCKFFAPSITYLGHKINKDGLSTLENKVQGIVDAPTPSNVSQLRSFLGTVNYYGNFIPNLSTRLAPLNNLLKVKIKWNWTQDCNEAFLDIKKCLSTSPVLAHFDPNERLVVACDASPYGVAAVLSHRYASGSETANRICLQNTVPS